LKQESAGAEPRLEGISQRIRMRCPNGFRLKEENYGAVRIDRRQLKCGGVISMAENLDSSQAKGMFKGSSS
jgi:hypothetical protein